MTNDLERRMFEHKTKAVDGFTAKYNVDQLVWFESTNDIYEAIAFEKKIKGWKRERKIALIEAENPNWDDLAAIGRFPKKPGSFGRKLPQDDR